MQRRRDPFRFPGLANQTHADLLGHMASFAMIASNAAGHDIFPGFGASFNNGNHVVKGKICCRASISTVLACMVIPRVDVGSAEFNMPIMLPDLYIPEKPEDAGHFNSEADAPDFLVVLREDFHFFLTKQTDGALPGDDADRFVGRI